MNFKKWSNSCDERPRRQLVTPSGCEWVRPILVIDQEPRIICESIHVVPGPTRVNPSNGISISSAILALLTPESLHAFQWAG